MRPLPDRLRPLLQGSFLRFLAASLFGLGFDIALAGILHHAGDLALPVAATLSLLAAAVMMYFVHEFWTFWDGAGTLSLSRLGATVASALTALAVRILFLHVTMTLLDLGERFAVLQLAAATGLSFMVNYVLVRRIIGGRRRA